MSRRRRASATAASSRRSPPGSTKITSYDEIYLGFSIWGETTPPPVRSFLKAHDLGGKTLRPFITHGGDGMGEAPSVLASHARAARIENAFVLEADQERRTLNQVRDWLGRLQT